MSIQSLLLTQIDLGASTQARVEVSQETINEYRDLIMDGVELPPITVYFDGAKHYCSDGFHRLRAHKAAGKIVIHATVILGTQDDATFAAAGANTEHGLRRNNEDKRKAVSMALGCRKCEGMSDREIARHCGVSHTLIARSRAESVSKATKPKHSPLATVATLSETMTPAEKEHALGKQGSPLGSYTPPSDRSSSREHFDAEPEDVLRIPETRFDRMPLAQGLPALANCLEQIAENTSGDVSTLAGWVSGQLSAMSRH